MSKDKAVDFESSLQTLEQLVGKMEAGDLSLEASLKAFEEGIKLTRECQQALQNAEQKVQVLMQKNGEVIQAPLPDLDDDNGQ